MFRKQIASNSLILSGSKFAKSSLTTASKAPVLSPSSLIAAFPVGIEPCRNPFVTEKTSIFRAFFGSAFAFPGTASPIRSSTLFPSPGFPPLKTKAAATPANPNGKANGNLMPKPYP